MEVHGGCGGGLIRLGRESNGRFHLEVDLGLVLSIAHID